MVSNKMKVVNPQKDADIPQLLGHDPQQHDQNCQRQRAKYHDGLPSRKLMIG